MRQPFGAQLQSRAIPVPPAGDAGAPRERFLDLLSSRLPGHALVVVANREPYVHHYEEGAIRCLQPAGGLTAALDPVLQACGGTWIAHGGGQADREAADEQGRLRVPPGDPRYTLRRVWLTPEEEKGYYLGFSNETLWPLCHAVFQRPEFRTSDWEQYERVNRRFADAVVEEIGRRKAFVFIQDYHFALLPRMIRRRAPWAVIAQFWHIPWPNPEIFRICPWKEEILKGLLGNDLLSFHIQYHCNNFLETVDRELECRIDRERFAVVRRGRPTCVRPSPIGIDVDRYSEEANSPQVRALRDALARDHRLDGLRIAVGCDRIDYTKGIPERLLAVDRFLRRRPEYRGRFAFVQISTPSRVQIPGYRSLNARIDALIDEINARHASGGWRPVLHLKGHNPRPVIQALYRLADVCLVTSLHDGMNLVAKEFVAARASDDGVLILSPFTGAAREMTEALVVNPYSIDGLADALHQALEMPAGEQARRMRRLKRKVAESNVYRWMETIVSTLIRSREAATS